MDAKKLIESVQAAYGAKDLTALAVVIDIPYPTLAKWHSQNKIPEQGTGRQYLELHLKHKRLEEEVSAYRDLGTILNKIQNLSSNQNDKDVQS